MSKPYIGITGFMERKEAEEVLSIMPDNCKYDLMVGVLASAKTIAGEKNKYPNRYPSPEKIKGIFPQHPLALNLIHYHTKNPETLRYQMESATLLADHKLHGFQLNVCWPMPAIISAYRCDFPSKTIVLQVGKRAFEETEYSPSKLAGRLREYDDSVDYALLDLSGGYGNILNGRMFRPFLAELYSRNFRMKFGIAGGLSSLSLHLIHPLVAEFPYLSIDAEGRLRDQNDNLNLAAAKAYVHDALKLLA